MDTYSPSTIKTILSQIPDNLAISLEFNLVRYDYSSGCVKEARKVVDLHEICMSYKTLLSYNLNYIIGEDHWLMVYDVYKDITNSLRLISKNESNFYIKGLLNKTSYYELKNQVKEKFEVSDKYNKDWQYLTVEIELSDNDFNNYKIEESDYEVTPNY
jgi:hypothetical protein